MTSGTNEFSVMQFNCLADALSDAFPHVSKDVLSWSHRMRLFEKLFASYLTTFCVLKRWITLTTSSNRSCPSWGILGVSISVVQDRRPSLVDGVALFWRSDRFTLCSEDAVRSEKKTFGIVGRL
jgi:hypothetical protein